ncbi:dihydrofolate reductase family protein [Angustibacter peucedani]
MTFTTAHLSISLDGFAAGPDQSLDHPLGRGGFDLHRWHIETEGQHEVDAGWTEQLLRPRGAYVMGRNMFGPVRGPWETWDGEWTGWWGDEPPYHAPVFVLTHHEREPVELQGTTFHFVTGGVAEALERAREAGDGDVDIAGGASAVRQVMALGELDELSLDVAPVLLGSGERLFDDGLRGRLEQVEVEHSPLVTHLRYRVAR